MQIDIHSLEGQKKSSITVSEVVFGKDFNEALIHQVVTACLSNRRQGTHQQKTRAEVSGGGAKPWKQKGSGRARAGTTRGPIWRHGGVAFAARPGVYEQKINKKMYRGAMRAIFSQLLKDNRLIVVETLDIDTHKTKNLLGILTKINAKKPLIILDKLEQNITLAARNLVGVDLIPASAIDPVRLLSHESIVITKEALEKLNEGLSHD
jgi:large subunit ribosomal protein L4